METKIQERLRDLAKAAPRGLEVPPTLAPRAHRRVALTVTLTALVISIVAVGAFAGIRSFIARSSEPLNKPTPSTVAHLSAVQAWFQDARGRIVVSKQDGLIEAVDPVDPTKTYDLPSSYTGVPLSWSADGSRLLISADTLYVLSSDGAKTELTTGGMSWASMKPDGSAVVFQGGRGNLYLIGSDGSGRRLLASGQKGVSLFMPAWSPDGTQIAYVTTGRTPSTWTISVMNADGSAERVLVDLHGMHLTEAGWLSWSPDGSKLVFALNRCKLCAKIYVVNADGSGVHRLTSITDAISPVWSPDGTSIAFISGNAVTGSSKTLAIVDANGTGLVRLPTFAQVPFITWNPVR